MKSSRLPPWLGAGRRHAALALAAAAITAAPSAGAAIVVGSFDPAFGSAIANLGFRGTVQVDVPDACFALPPGTIANSAPCSSGAMSIVSTSVNFYNTATPGIPTFATAAAFPSGSVVSVATAFDGGTLQNELAGLTTTYGAWTPLTLSDPGPGAGSGDDVSFSGYMRLLFAFSSINQSYSAMLEACLGLKVACEGDQCAEGFSSSNPATLTFASRSAVPEPASGALVAAALAAAAWARRRRRPSGRAASTA